MGGAGGDDTVIVGNDLTGVDDIAGVLRPGLNSPFGLGPLVLVGDAFAFLDPVFSSGVFLALVGGEMAAEASLWRKRHLPRMRLFHNLGQMSRLGM